MGINGGQILHSNVKKYPYQSFFSEIIRQTSLNFRLTSFGTVDSSLKVETTIGGGGFNLGIHKKILGLDSIFKFSKFWHCIVCCGSKQNNMVIWLFHACFISLTESIYTGFKVTANNIFYKQTSKSILILALNAHRLMSRGIQFVCTAKVCYRTADIQI